MITLRTLRRLAGMIRNKPYIDLSRWGQLTDNPKVTVGVNSRTGMMSVYTHPDTDSGNAQAESLARSMNHITGLPVIDRRGILPKRLERTA